MTCIAPVTHDTLLCLFMVCLPHWNMSVNPRTTLVLAQCGHSVNSASCLLLPTGLLSRCPVQAHEGLQKAGTWVLKAITSLHWSQTPTLQRTPSMAHSPLHILPSAQILGINKYGTHGSWNVRFQQISISISLSLSNIKYQYHYQQIMRLMGVEMLEAKSMH